MPLTACFPPSPGVRPWKPALCVEGVSACGLAPRRARGPRVRRPPWTPRRGTVLIRRPRWDAGAPQNRRGASGRRAAGRGVQHGVQRGRLHTDSWTRAGHGSPTCQDPGDARRRQRGPREGAGRGRAPWARACADQTGGGRTCQAETRRSVSSSQSPAVAPAPSGGPCGGRGGAAGAAFRAPPSALSAPQVHEARLRGAGHVRRHPHLPLQGPRHLVRQRDRLPSQLDHTHP